MLSDNHYQLLTAYLDGALGARQRKTVLRLLHRSPEARELLRQMQEDSRRLQALPPRRLSQDFPLQVLRTIAERGVRPTPPLRPPVPARAVPAWFAFTAAAGLLLAVTAASYLYFSRLRPAPEHDHIVAKVDSPAPAPAPAPAPPPQERAVPLPPVPPPVPVPEPRLKLALHQLGEAAARTRLAQELQKDTSFRLSLGTRDNARAVDRLKTVLHTRGIKVVVDRQAQDSLKNKQKTRYLLYAENISPAELTTILQELGTEAKKTARARDGTFETVALNNLTSDDRQQMARLLGVSADKLQAPGRLPAGKQLPDDLFTENIIAGTGGASPSTAKTRPTPPQAERFALVLTSRPDHAGASPEVRRFLQHRQEQHPGTLQVILELQEVNA